MKLLTLAGWVLIVIVGVTALSIGFGGPGDLPPMSSINDPFKGLDYSDWPAARQFTGRDGTKLTFREYPVGSGNAKGSVVLVHGSAASGKSMHPLAKAFSAAGYTAFALDVRGHGESGSKGYINYVGQLEDDLEDFVHATNPQQPATLAGFSSGGGFALRFAGSARQQLFTNYLLLSPFISQEAPTYRRNGSGWVSIGVPRILAIGLLEAIGVHAFDRLPVIKYALNEEAKSFLTPQYAYALAQNFRPQRDWQANIRAVRQPVSLVAGRDDELFYAERFAEIFKAEGKDVHATLIEGIGHIAVTLEPTAIRAAVAAVTSMDGSSR